MQICSFLLLKGSVSRDVLPLFFHDSNPYGSMITRLKYFRIIFWFRQDIPIFKELHSVHHTVESSSAVCIVPWSQAPRCASHRGVKIKKKSGLGLLVKGQSGEIPLGVNSSIVKEKIWSVQSGFTKPKILTLRCHAQRVVRIF